MTTDLTRSRRIAIGIIGFEVFDGLVKKQLSPAEVGEVCASVLALAAFAGSKDGEADQAIDLACETAKKKRAAMLAEFIREE